MLNPIANPGSWPRKRNVIQGYRGRGDFPSLWSSCKGKQPWANVGSSLNWNIYINWQIEGMPVFVRQALLARQGQASSAWTAPVHLSLHTRLSLSLFRAQCLSLMDRHFTHFISDRKADFWIRGQKLWIKVRGFPPRRGTKCKLILITKCSNDSLFFVCLCTIIFVIAKWLVGLQVEHFGQGCQACERPFGVKNSASQSMARWRWWQRWSPSFVFLCRFCLVLGRNFSAIGLLGPIFSLV